MRNNVTEVYFNGQEMTAILVHWQHDYKQILKFADLDLPFAYEVDFANAGDTQSKTMIGNADGVEIPDEYLMTGKAINAYIYLHDASDSGETVRKVSIQVHGRPERTEEIPEPHQQSLIEQAIATLDAAVEQTASDVQTTGEYKEEAHGYADEAKGYAERAESAESEVEGYAIRAETAESHAQGYAQTASDKASEASGYASDAHGDANSASSSASDAHRYASDAYGYADSAYQSYQGASGSASDASSAKDLAVQAKNDAISAKNDAVSAKNDAETAKGKAEDAQESAERAAGSVLGLTADATVDANIGTPSVEVDVTTEADHKKMSFAFHNIKGVQGNPGISPTITVTEITGGHSVAVTDAQGTQTFNVMDGEVSEQDLEDALIDKADVITSSASGEIVTIQDGAKNLPVVDLKLSLLPIQDLHGQDAPYPPGGGKNLFDEENANWKNDYYIDAEGVEQSNDRYKYCQTYIPVLADTTYAIRMVKGTSVQVGLTVPFYDSNKQFISRAVAISSTADTGVLSGTVTTPVDCAYLRISCPVTNTTNIQIEKGSSSTSYAPYSNVCPITGWTGVDIYHVDRNLFDRSLSAVGKYMGSNGSQTENVNYGISQYIPIEPGATYTLAGMEKNTTSNVGARYYSGSDHSTGVDGFKYGSNYNPRTFVVPDNATWIRFSVRLDMIKQCRLVKGTNTEEAIPISWQSSAGTVYGCTVKPTIGKLIVDHQMFLFDSSDVDNWVASSFTSNCFVRSRPTGFTQTSADNWKLKYYSNALQTTTRGTSSSNIPNNGMYAGSSYLIVRIDSFNWDINTFKSFLTNTGLQIITPITAVEYQLSENQIATLLGTNVFWSNGNGTLDLEYRADTKLYIEQLTKPTEDDMVANSNITSGSFFMVGNRLFLSTVAIGQGEAIVPGTNCSEVSLADALNSINS